MSPLVSPCSTAVANHPTSARALQRALDRRLGCVEHVGDFGRAIPEHLAQHQRCTLAGRQVLQRGREREPHGLPRRVTRLRPRGGTADPLKQYVGVRVEPHRLGHPGGLWRFGHRRYLPWAALAVAERVQAAIGGDPVQPGPERGALLEAGQPVPCRQQRLLQYFLGVVERPKDSVAVQMQLPPVRLDQRGECQLVACLCLFDRHSHTRTPTRPKTNRFVLLGVGVSSFSPIVGRTKRRTDMGKIVMSGPQNVSLDGVVQDPDGEEGFKRGGWFVEFGGVDLEAWNKVALGEALGAEAWLLGRRSYEFFGARWRSRTGELADRLNNMPKYVVSSTLVDPDWNNSRVLEGDVVTEVSKLKQELDGDIVVPASYQLGRTLMGHNLVDELRLAVFPVVLGAGKRFFGDTGDEKPMR